MSTAPDDEFQPKAEEGVEASTTADATQNDYKSRTGQSGVPVQGDDAPVNDPINPNTADLEEQLGICFRLKDWELRLLSWTSSGW